MNALVPASEVSPVRVMEKYLVPVRDCRHTEPYSGLECVIHGCQYHGEEFEADEEGNPYLELVSVNRKRRIVRLRPGIEAPVVIWGERFRFLEDVRRQKPGGWHSGALWNSYHPNLDDPRRIAACRIAPQRPENAETLFFHTVVAVGCRIEMQIESGMTAVLTLEETNQKVFSMKSGDRVYDFARFSIKVEPRDVPSVDDLNDWFYGKDAY